MLWLRELSNEMATVAFYVNTGYKFRPMINNPYLELSTVDVDEQLEEFGLDDDDDDLRGDVERGVTRSSAAPNSE